MAESHKELKISFESKRRTHTHTRESNDAIIKAFYTKYCKTLNKVIEEAKKTKL
jgi:hypothetical protein